jgi:hypothetical protein
MIKLPQVDLNNNFSDTYYIYINSITLCIQIFFFLMLGIESRASELHSQPLFIFLKILLLAKKHELEAVKTSSPYMEVSAS